MIINSYSAASIWLSSLPHLPSVSPCRACEELVRTLGFDWLLMFMEEHLHSSTVTAALWILVVLLSNQSILNRFKEGLCGGGWLDHTDSVLTNKIGTVLGECTSLGWLSGRHGNTIGQKSETQY